MKVLDFAEERSKAATNHSSNKAANLLPSRSMILPGKLDKRRKTFPHVMTFLSRISYKRSDDKVVLFNVAVTVGDGSHFDDTEKQ